MSIEKWKVIEKLSSVLFYDLNFKKVKVDVFNEIITGKACFTETFEISNVFVKPDRLREIKLVASLLQRTKNFVGTCVRTLVCNTDILKHMVIFKNPCPKPKHVFLTFCSFNGSRRTCSRFYGKGFPYKAQVF